MQNSKSSRQHVKQLVVFLYIFLTCVLAAATVVEHVGSSDFVSGYIYGSPAFCSLWGVLCVAAIIYCCRQRLWKRLPLVLLHGSFLVILGGALLTYLYGVQGHLHLRPGQTATSFTQTESGQPADLTFTLHLDSFRIAYYPGTEAPADYISYVTYNTPAGKSRSKQISMNRILTVEGVRFYQSSYDEDGKGSWLAVNYDPLGTRLTYIGYFLLIISMIWLLLARGEGFRHLLGHPLLKKSGIFVLVLLASTHVLWATVSPVSANALPVLARKQADSLCAKQVIYHDRVVPFNTLARDFVQKLTGGDATYCGFSPEQVICSWLLYPDAWQNEPMIYIKSAELCHRLNLSSPYASLKDLYTTDRVYRLQAYWQELHNGNKKNEKLRKAIQETDEKVGLIGMLQKGTLIRPVPTDGSVRRLSKWRIRAELFYNRVPFTKLLFMVNLTLGLLAFLHLLYCALSDDKKSNAKIHKRNLLCFLRSHSIPNFFAALLVASFVFHLSGYLLRWYIGGRIPLSNGHETMLFLAGCILLFACLLQHRFPFTVPFGFLLSGFALLVAYLGQKNPQITPLMPVLLSPWLSIHVSLIMVSYALFAFMMLNGLLAFCIGGGGRRTSTSELLRQRQIRIKQLMLFSHLMLYPAVFCLGAGIFIGAVWANVSWGRYWAWDPKEVWALITFLVYGAALHGGSVSRFRQPRFFHTYMVLAFLTVLMTYFGVNYLLGGMHSYA